MRLPGFCSQALLAPTAGDPDLLHLMAAPQSKTLIKNMGKKQPLHSP